MYASTVDRVARALPRMPVLVLLLALLACMTGMTHAPVPGAAPAHGSAVSAPESHAMPMPPTGDSGHCSAATDSPGGCLTVSPGQPLAAPPASFIGWLTEAPRPAQALLHPTAYRPPAPTPGELSINRT